MSDQPLENKQVSYIDNIVAWAKVCANIIEDISRGILSFIPKGLQGTYDAVFKNLPLLGNMFSQRWVEQGIKLCTGITIGIGLAADIAHFIFWPLGFIVGLLVGILLGNNSTPTYRQQIGKGLDRFAVQTIGGALASTLLFFITSLFTFSLYPFIWQNVLIAASVGAFLGIMAKTMFLFAVNTIQNANAAAVRRNVQRAKELNAKLKVIAKQKTKSRILMQAQDIILQMHGPQSQQHLEVFFAEKFEEFAQSTYYKIDRHFDYLTDRACHGDIKALQKLQMLISKQIANTEQNKPALDLMLDRIFNYRALAKIKDDVDTQYDRWHYRFLATPA